MKPALLLSLLLCVHAHASMIFGDALSSAEVIAFVSKGPEVLIDESRSSIDTTPADWNHTEEILYSGHFIVSATINSQFRGDSFSVFGQVVAATGNLPDGATSASLARVRVEFTFELTEGAMATVREGHDPSWLSVTSLDGIGTFLEGETEAFLPAGLYRSSFTAETMVGAYSFGTSLTMRPGVPEPAGGAVVVALALCGLWVWRRITTPSTSSVPKGPAIRHEGVRTPLPNVPLPGPAGHSRRLPPLV